MKVRVLTSIGIAVIGLPILFLSEYLVYPMAIALLSLAAMYEMTALTGFRSKPAVWVPSYLLVMAMPIGAYFVNADSFTYLAACGGALLLFLFYLYGYAILKRGTVKFANESAFTKYAPMGIAITSR